MNDETKEVLNVVKDMFTELSKQIRDVESRLTSEVQDVRSELKSEIQDVRSEVQDIKIILENETNRNIKLLVDGYTTNTEKLDKIEPTLKQVKEKTDIIELAVKSHSHDIGYLKKVK